MIDDKKIEEVRKQIKKTINGQEMFIDDEPEFSGDPKNTIEKDPEEGEIENKDEAKRKIKDHLKNMALNKKPFVVEDKQSRKK